MNSPPDRERSLPLFLLSSAELARALGISLRHLCKLESSGHLGPRPVRLGRSVRYDMEEVLAWLAAGAPDRHSWQKCKEARDETKE